jgi:hypothetical protein
MGRPWFPECVDSLLDLLTVRQLLPLPRLERVCTVLEAPRKPDGARLTSGPRGRVEDLFPTLSKLQKEIRWPN